MDEYRYSYHMKDGTVKFSAEPHPEWSRDYANTNVIIDHGVEPRILMRRLDKTYYGTRRLIDENITDVYNAKLSREIDKNDAEWERALSIMVKTAKDGEHLKQRIEDLIEYGPRGPVGLGLKENGSFNMGGHAIGED